MRIWIVSTAAGGFVGRAIRWFSRGDVSHSLVLLDVPWLAPTRWNVLEAGARGFFPVPVDQQRAKTWRRAYLYLGTAEESRALVARLAGRFGRRYDWIGIARWASLGIWNRITGRDDRPHFRGPKRDYCSEAVAEAFGFEETRLTPWQLDQKLNHSAIFAAVDIDALRAAIAAGGEV